MTRSTPGLQRCTYCLRHFRALTSDHVIPESWYPESAPENLEKWQAPACNDCNSRFGKVEAKLLEYMGLCVDPDSHEGLGIADKALRTFNPDAAKNRKDRWHREKKLESLVRHLIPSEEVLETAVLPGFEDKYAEFEDPPPAVGIPVQALESFLEKVTRGLVYALERDFIEATHSFEFHYTKPDDMHPLHDLLAKFGAKSHRGPGVEITIATTSDGTGSRIVKILLWQQLSVLVTVLPKSRPDS